MPQLLHELQTLTQAAAEDRVETKHCPEVQTVLQQQRAGFCRAAGGNTNTLEE